MINFVIVLKQIAMWTIFKRNSKLLDGMSGYSGFVYFTFIHFDYSLENPRIQFIFYPTISIFLN